MVIGSSNEPPAEESLNLTLDTGSCSILTQDSFNQLFPPVLNPNDSSAPSGPDISLQANTASWDQKEDSKVRNI